jgi:type IX secretion system PorP/SprF family membrane protein
MRFFTILILLIGFIAESNAQQEAQYTQFVHNNALINPSFVGVRRTPSVMALYRNQWLGFKGNPRSYLIGFDMPVPKYNRLGAGIILSKQSEGIISRTNTNLALSYSLIQTEDATLRIGISSTLRQYRFDLLNPTTYVQDRQDASLSKSDQLNISKINFGTGIYYDRKRFYFGVSVPNLAKNTLYLNVNSKTQVKGYEHQHFYIMAGGLLPVGNDDLQFKPSVLFKYVKNAPYSLDANASVLIKKRLMMGASYRYGGSGGTGDSVDLLALIQMEKGMAIGLAYDIPLSQLGGYTKGGIEVLLRYDIAFNAKLLHNPRFFF